MGAPLGSEAPASGTEPPHHVLRLVRRETWTNGTHHLTGQPLAAAELRVLEEMAVHGGWGEVGRCLGLARSTVKNEVTAAYVRLGVTGLIDAFRALGWLHPHRCVPGEFMWSSDEILGQTTWAS